MEHFYYAHLEYRIKVNIFPSLVAVVSKVVYMVNKVVFRKHFLQLPVVYETESTTSCQ